MVSNWQFGQYASIEFVGPVPYGGSYSAMSSYEGCATISNPKGNLLFYTDGVEIFNAGHNALPIVNPLQGNTSSTQSAIIIPKPGNPEVYYIVTTNGISGVPSKGAYISEMDMRLNGGLGGISPGMYNKELLKRSDEKVSVTAHANHKDYWILIPERLSNHIHAFLITENGLITPPVISKVPNFFYGDLGYMKISPEGDKLAMAFTNNSQLVTGLFNNATGEVSHFTTINVNAQPYGVEFSPSGKYIFVSHVDGAGIYRYDFYVDSQHYIKQSAKLIAPRINIYGALQLAHNGKIYIARHSTQFLDVINDPDAHFSNYQEKAVFFNGTCYYGLPHFISSVFRKKKITHSFDGYKECKQWVHLHLDDSSDIYSAEWNIKINGKSQYLGKKRNITLLLDTGKYFLYCILNQKDTVFDTISVLPILNKKIKLDSLVAICSQENIFLGMPGSNDQWRWSTGSKRNVIEVNTPGIYKYEVIDKFGCQFADSVVVKLIPPLLPMIEAPKELCENEFVWIKENSGNAYLEYAWKVMEDSGIREGNTSTFKAFPHQVYYLKVKDSTGCIFYDTAEIKGIPLPKFSLPADTLLCKGDSLKLRVPLNHVKCLWNNGSTSQSIVANRKGIWHVTVTDLKCKWSDTIELIEKEYPHFNFRSTDTVCNNIRYAIHIPVKAESYRWDDGTKEPAKVLYRPGIYWAEAANGPCVSRDTIALIPQIKKIFIPTAFSPNGDGINDEFLIGQHIEFKQVKIYNRWGELILDEEVHAGTFVWNGMHNGNSLPGGVYVVFATYLDCSGNLAVVAQDVTLLR